QRQYVADAAVPQFVEDAADLVGRVPDAGEVRHRADADLVLDLPDQVHRLLPRAPAGAVGHRDVAGVVWLELLDRLVELREPLLVLRREELEAHRRSAESQDLIDTHGVRLADNSSLSDRFR